MARTDPESVRDLDLLHREAGIPPMEQVLEVRLQDPSIGEDVVQAVAPLLLTLARSLRSTSLALVAPEAMVASSSADPRGVLFIRGGSADETADTLIFDAIAAARTKLADRERVISLDLSPDRDSVHVAACPIPLNGDGPGMLAALRTSSVGFAEDDLSMVGDFASAISSSLRLIYRQRGRERASAALLDVARTAGSTLQLEEVLSLVTERTASLVGADRCGVWLVDKDVTTLHPSALYGMPEEFVRDWKRRPLSVATEPLSRGAIVSEMPVLVADAPADPRTNKDAVEFFGDKTILVLPMIAKGQVQGTLMINHVRSHHAYSKAEIDTAIAIANQAAIAIQNARLYRQVEEWNSQLERLQAIMSKLSRSKSVSSIASIVADELRDVIHYDNCRVLVLQDGTNELVPLAVVSSAQEYPVDKLERLRLEIGQGITGFVAATGTPLLVGDASRDPRAYQIPDTEVVDESMIAAPINFEGRVIGVITLSRLGLSRFTDDELRLLDVFANEAAIEFENARLYQETQKKGQELLASFHRVGDALATGSDPDQTLQIIVDLAAEMVRAKACAILLLDENSGELVLRASRGLPVAMQARRIDVGRDASWLVVNEGASALVPEIPAEERPAWMMEAGIENLRSYLGVPLTLQGKVIGVLSVFGSRPGQFAEADEELLSSFGHQAAIALRNAQLFTSLQERVRELTGLAEVSQSVATLTNLDDTYRELTRSIAQLLEAQTCVILLAGMDGQLSPQQPCFGFGHRELSGLKLRLGDDQAVPAEPQCPIQSVDGLGVTCRASSWRRGPSLLAPMKAQDRLIGAVLVGGREAGVTEAFNEDDVRLLTILAANAAVIVQNAVLYQSVDRERDELEAIISNTSDAIVIVDQSDRVTRINAAAEALIGWAAEDGVGRRWDEILSSHAPIGDSKSGLSLQDVVGTRRPTPYFETVIVTKDGLRRDVAASYSFVRSAARGEGLGVIIARDISKLRELDRMKSEFVSMVSHELRTPLGLIKGYASTLINPQLALDEQTVQRFLIGIDGAADRLAKLIENVLSASRIESGMFRLSTQEVDLSGLVGNAVATARSLSKQHDISLALPRRPLTVEGDRVQLELVMDNLLNNACKYSPMGKPIRVQLARQGSDAVVRVVDQGIGIGPHHLPRVFDKFYRVEGGYSRRTPGSGLGLYICRNIVEAHHGRILVESTPGAGSTFSFVLPLAQAVQPPAASPDLSRSETEQEPVHE